MRADVHTGREYRYVVDRDGRVFHDGTEIIDPATLRFFVGAMTRAPDGRYLVVCQGEQNWFDAVGTPLVVQRLGLEVDGARLVRVDLRLAGDWREPLDPSTLVAAGDDVLCRVRRRDLFARFGRVAMQQLAPFLVDDAAGPSLVLAGARYPIRPLSA